VNFANLVNLWLSTFAGKDFLAGLENGHRPMISFAPKATNLWNLYDRPVFFNNKINPGRFEIIMFVGRRWVLFERVNETQASLEAYLNDFHAHFSAFTVSFISEPMRVGTPTDALTPVGLEWFLPSNGATRQGGIQSVDSTRASDTILLCAVCNNGANVCQNNGKCENDTCMCDIGSSGRLCEKPPIGNGRCDSFFNFPEFNLDGGDCCEQTCVSSSEYLCGKDDTGYGDIGYPSCKLGLNHWNPNSKPIPGSQTLASSGSSVALSGNGAILAIGEPGIDAVRLMYKDGSNWIQQDVLEGPPGTEFGFSVVMSDGSANVVSNPSGRAPVTIAIGAPLYGEGGMVRVYGCTILRCIKVEDIVGSRRTADGLAFGAALAISENGEYLAVSNSPGSIGYVEYQKSVGVYHISDLSVRGGFLTPVERSTLSNFGQALSLSANGDVLAVGSSNGRGSLIVHMFKWNETSGLYEFDNTEIDAGNPSQSLRTVALSSDAMVLAIASSFDSAVVYQRTQTDLEWTKRGLITGSCCSVVLSSDGSIISVGTEDGSSVRTFKWNNSDYEQLWNDVPGGEELALSGNGQVLAVGLPSSEFNRGETTVYGFLSDCGIGTDSFRLSLTFDDYAKATRWKLISSSDEIVMEGENYAEKYSFMTVVEETCLAKDECFRFTIFAPSANDRFVALPGGDVIYPNGITLPGGYIIYLNGEEHYKGGNFTESESVNIGNCACPEGSSRVRTEIILGNEPPENTRWEIVDEVSNQIILQNDNYPRSSETHVEEACLPTDCCLSFTITQKDANISGELVVVAEYTLYLNGDVIKKGGGSFSLDTVLQGSDFSQTFWFGNNCEPTPTPTQAPTIDLSTESPFPTPVSPVMRLD
jgi:hypothetical protein